MADRRRTLLLAAVIAAAAVAALVAAFGFGVRPWRAGGSKPRRLAVRASHPLDVARFRAQVARRRQLARALAAARRAAAAPDRPDSAHRTGLYEELVSPRCIVGPAILCAAVGDTVADCEDGDARACLAVGQYLEDEPPRAMVSLVFFYRACKLGDPTGCERRDQLREGTPPAVCDDDPLACAWQGVRARDVDRIDQACALGVADACAKMLDHVDDPTRQRAYLELSCQLANPMACAELARRLGPDCREAPCYLPDPEQAAAAATIACEAGFEEACPLAR